MQFHLILEGGVKTLVQGEKMPVFRYVGIGMILSMLIPKKRYVRSCIWILKFWYFLMLYKISYFHIFKVLTFTF